MAKHRVCPWCGDKVKMVLIGTKRWCAVCKECTVNFLYVVVVQAETKKDAWEAWDKLGEY